MIARQPSGLSKRSLKAMSSLFFPQLASGALAQYPIKKTRLVRTIKNVLADGSMVLLNDPNGGHQLWQLAYTGLGTTDIQALQGFFALCAGPFKGFTFIDPTENMLVWSSDLTDSAWTSGSLLQIQPGLADPNGGTAGFTVTNSGQAPLQISQTLTVPANYQYCFCLYAMSAQSPQIVLTRSGPVAQDASSVTIGPQWTRVVSTGQLDDTGTQFTVGISLAAGQQVGLYGPQLEPQVSPSRYRPTGSMGGVFGNAHWGMDQLATAADAPGLYSTTFSIETVIQD